MMQKVGPVSALKALARILTGKPRIPASVSENQLLSAIIKRRSIRSFTGQEISEDRFAAILEAGRVAPSTVNLQTWTFAVFSKAQWQEKFERNIPFKGDRAVIIMGDLYRIRQTDVTFPSSPLIEYTIAVMNASLAAMNMNVAAEALGISSVMLSETGRSGLLDMAYLKEKLGLPEGVFPLMTIVFGYAKGFYPPMPPKLPLEQIAFSDHYPEPKPVVLKNWLEEMIAGYKASHLNSSFDAQLKIYQTKIGQAESDLRAMVFRKPE